ncbi:fused FliR family export protein/FlhB family type III secretion system protein [Clostridium sp. UBA4548]|uniref:fused FliR family export protein/FlhB family type III secretion system protein n=1 Tax=Clostridium sp. UBA4548 TaxID=1946361 RepID=UPI0025BB390D|nr:fused FliR family export protein/FlhB family type III secretion system protein [Clostridium sp. UBA4548]
MIDLTLFVVFFMVFLRFTSLIFSVQAFFPSDTPALLKIGLSMVISIVITPFLDSSSVVSINSMMGIIPIAFKEIIVGLSMGFVINLIFSMAQMAGQMMDFSIGFSMMTLFDPIASENLSVMGRLLYWISLIVFILVDGHLIVIKALIDSFNVVALGSFTFLTQHSTYMIHLIFEFFIIGVKIAIPIILILLITEIVLGLVSRVMPQLNVMIMGMPIKLLVGLSAFGLLIPMIMKVVVTNIGRLDHIFTQYFNILPFLVMFVASDSGEKTEEATPKKKKDAKEKGQVIKSKELTSAIVLLTTTIVILIVSEFAVNKLKETIILYLHYYPNFVLNNQSFKGILINSFIRIMMIFLPIAIPIMIIGVVANVAQTGKVLTTETLKPKLEKINPISGFKRMFSIKALVDLIKNIIIVTIVGYVGYGFVKDNYYSIINYNNFKVDVIVTEVSKLIISIFSKVSMVLIAIGVMDYVYQRYQYNKDLKMTKQEVKEEFKQQEGDPLVKSKIRQKQRDMAMRRMMQSIPDATVVITNPTHIAIALKYEENSGKAPIVVAKGSDNIAVKIKEIAIENKVPIIENKPLARLMFSKVELDEEVPYDMYQAVAEILVLVVKASSKK